MTFNLERDNRPLIELFDKDGMKESFFYRQYELAAKLIAKHLYEEKEALPETEFESFTDGNNNIFAFVGDRGTGKTSCMLSVANSLVNKNKAGFEQQVLNQTEFFTIGLLDPSYFDSEHDILMLFVAKLYALFLEKAKIIDPEQDDYQLKTKLLKSFSATQKHIHSLLHADKVEGDEFERLTSYAVAIDLKKDICRLINLYREFIGKKDAVMLLMVDDIDLNTSEASRMAELLRKYFVQPHTIVLLSVKLDQLSYIKKLDLTKEFGKIVGKGIEEQEIDEMAERYLSKFLPQEHRIFLPTPELYFDEMLEIETATYKRNFCSVKQAIPELIYWKTRYLFYNFDGETSYIVPRNLRDLRQLLKVLLEMDGDLSQYELDSNSDKAKEIKNRNRKVFQNYLYEDWLVNNLDNETIRQVRHILAADEAYQLNNAILQVLKERFAKDFDDVKVEEIRSIRNADNKSFNISMGDIVGLLNLLSIKKVSVADRKLIFFLRTILAMKLYEYEAEINKAAEESNALKVEPRRYSDDSKDYFKLIGGRLINTRLMELLPKKSENALSRSNRAIHRKVVETHIADLIKGQQTDYRALELLMLCTFRNTTPQDDIYRTENRIAHADLQGGRDFVFEIGALFNNILDRDKCYQRFANLGGDYETVVNQIKEGGEGRTTLYQSLAAIRERMTFRSLDLLQYFINYIGNIHYSSIDSPFDVILNFLGKVSKFEFQTYRPVYQENKAVGMTKVTFEPLKEVFNFAGNANLRTHFDSLFGDEENNNLSDSGTAEDKKTLGFDLGRRGRHVVRKQSTVDRTENEQVIKPALGEIANAEENAIDTAAAPEQ